MSKPRKRKIPMKTRRNIFYLFCIVIVCLILIGCVKGCDKEVATADLQVSAADDIVMEVPMEKSRYYEIHIEAWELEEMAAIIYLEARNQSAEGQQAVAEVILNRVLYDGFPDSVSEVIHEVNSKGVAQFTTVYKLSEAKPTAAQYKAVIGALYGEPVLPLDVVFFSRGGENDRVYKKIDDHIFCYAYKWE